VRVRVLHLITRLDLGGAQQNTLYSVGHHDRSRFDVFLIAGRGGVLDAEAAALADTRVELVGWLKHAISPVHDPLALGIRDPVPEPPGRGRPVLQRLVAAAPVGGIPAVERAHRHVQLPERAFHPEVRVLHQPDDLALLSGRMPHRPTESSSPSALFLSS